MKLNLLAFSGRAKTRHRRVQGSFLALNVPSSPQKISWLFKSENWCIAEESNSWLPQKIQPHSGSLHCRCNVTLVSSVCKAVLRSLFWVPRGLNELLKMNFKFHFNMIGKRQWLFEQASHGAYPNRGPEHMVFIKNSSSGERCNLTGEYFKRGSMSE